MRPEPISSIPGIGVFVPKVFSNRSVRSRWGHYERGLPRKIGSERAASRARSLPGNLAVVNRSLPRAPDALLSLSLGNSEYTN